MPDYLLAHDLGTTGDKATLFRCDGGVVASAFAPYETHYPRAGWAEQNPADWFRAVCNSSRDLLSRIPDASANLRGVGFSAMMNGCLLLDEKGEPLGNALIHADTRSVAQCARISQEVGEESAYRKTGNRIAPYFTLGKLAWLAENEPDRLMKARWCVQAKDYIAGELTGVRGKTDFSDASLTGYFDLERRVWAEEMIAAGRFSTSLLPEALPSATVLGGVTPEAARLTGLPVGLPVVIGGGDGACATAGAGAISQGDAYHYLGGTSWVAALTEAYRPDPSRRVSVFCGLEPGSYVVYGTVQSAGSSVDWFRHILGLGEEEADFAELERLASAAPAGCNGLYFLPYLAGERSPIWDAQARGVFFGLSTAHGRGEVARAVFEGVAYALASNLAVLETLGLAPQKVRVLGGGMRSPLWRSILAAVYQRPLVLLERLAEATSCGAAMATAVGIGACATYAEAAPRFAPVGEEETPNAEVLETYARGFEFFQTLYPALAERFAEAHRQAGR